MRTVTIDLLNDNALELLKQLELQNIIRLHEKEFDQRKNNLKGLKGAMTKQSRSEIDAQLNELRNSWE